MTRDKRTCLCGHEHEAHEHYRHGKDCGHIGCDCLHYRPRGYVLKLPFAVIRDGRLMRWLYSVPTKTGELVGWRETHAEAIRECHAQMKEREEKA